MSEQGNRTTVLLFGALAAAAGLAVAAYVLRVRSGADRGPGEDERSVTEVLQDCYKRLRDVQSGLAHLHETA